MALDERSASSLSEIKAIIGCRSGEQASALTAFGLPTFDLATLNGDNGFRLEGVQADEQSGAAVRH